MEYKDHLYGICLPHPNRPAYNPDAMLYVGTEEEIVQYVDRLDENSKSAYFKEFIHAVRNRAEDPKARHTVAGRSFPALIPVKEIGRKGFSLSDHQWTYKSSVTGNDYLVRAQHIDVSYLVIEVAGNLTRCDKAVIERLSVSIPGIGWVLLGNLNNGTPEMIYASETADRGDDAMYMSLHRQGKVYNKDQTPAAVVDDLPGLLSIDLNACLAEVFGQL